MKGSDPAFFGLNLRNFAFAFMLGVLVATVGFNVLDWEFWLVVVPLSLLYWWGRREAP